MTSPREPDRFEAQAREILAADDWKFHERIAAALRAEHASAMQASIDACDDAIGALQGDREIEAALECIKRIRALIPPAAAPAAETGKAQGAEALQSIRIRITEYLSHGGLLNPDLMDHDAVSRLLRDTRAAIDTVLAARAAPPEREGK